MAVNKILYSVDASVILKWFLKDEYEKDQKDAIMLRDDFFRESKIFCVWGRIKR